MQKTNIPTNFKKPVVKNVVLLVYKVWVDSFFFLYSRGHDQAGRLEWQTLLQQMSK